jgi:CubicO group peptidase (beta-lactamase class C family)
MEGVTRVLHGGSHALALQMQNDADLAAIATGASTQALLRAHADGRVDAWFATGVDEQSQVDWRGLAPVVLAPLYAQLVGDHPDLLDTPVGSTLSAWSADRRGAITPRQLFWQLSGMPAGDFEPLNPFNTRAQLAAGPDFARAALRWQPVWPPGSHFEQSPVNAQLLALLSARLEGAAFATLLEDRLWSRVAAGDATVMLDHRRGDMAAHCCMRARIGDWLRMALALAADGHVGGEELWEPGTLARLVKESPVHESYGLGFQLLTPAPDRQLLMATSTGRQLLIAPRTSTVVLWVGEGMPPPELARLLP